MKRKIENKDLQGSWDNKNKYILRNFVTTRLEILIQRKKINRMTNNRQIRNTWMRLAKEKRFINLILPKPRTRKNERKDRRKEEKRRGTNLRLSTYLLNGVKH